MGLTPQQLSSREESPGYPLNKMLGGPNVGTDVLIKKKKNLLALPEIYDSLYIDTNGE